ncbi:hypothetical protein TCAL_11036 [Tigriopus californicus]|uniref:Ras-associating domain-containing protein n=1 Tax=Tigriopus californicus TaxID=6832 RepID=A0A553NC13_TIGCA|nr:hypothetical protein TCAL_11036 [Tigriopus californicus]|eukprot:TCALIF_11036-PA protein Name:"Protein of unknown function" AED:0.00 eAED:0.00 QI:278/1/1/1/0/0.5/2/380/105
MPDHYCQVNVLLEGGHIVSLGDISVSSIMKEIAARVKTRANLDELKFVFLGYSRNQEIVLLSEETSLAEAKAAIIRDTVTTSAEIQYGVIFHGHISDDSEAPPAG